VWDGACGATLGEPLQAHEGIVHSLAASADGSFLVSSCARLFHSEIANVARCDVLRPDSNKLSLNLERFSGLFKYLRGRGSLPIGRNRAGSFSNMPMFWLTCHKPQFTSR
jgi:hypothetical protein